MNITKIKIWAKIKYFGIQLFKFLVSFSVTITYYNGSSFSRSENPFWIILGVFAVIFVFMSVFRGFGSLIEQK